MRMQKYSAELRRARDAVREALLAKIGRRVYEYIPNAVPHSPVVVEAFRPVRLQIDENRRAKPLVAGI